MLYILRATPSLIRRLDRKRETGGGNLNALEGLFLFLVPSVINCQFGEISREAYIILPPAAMEENLASDEIR